jgi:hypothetical protein
MAFPEMWLRERLASATSAGIHPILGPQNADFPIIVYRRTGTRRERHLMGPVSKPVASFSVSIVAYSYAEVKEIADDVRLAVDNFTGTASGVTIEYVALSSESDNMERPLEGQSKPLYRVDQTYDVRFQEIVQGGA